MYEPKLPVSGYSFAILAFTPLLSNVVIILLVVTFLLVFFRFTRLLYKEKNLLNAILVLITLIAGMLLSIIIYQNVFNKDTKDTNIKTTDTIQISNLNDNPTYNTNENSNPKFENLSFNSGEKIGTLSIDSISLKIDVLEEASDENMFIGSGHILGTSYPWENGNSFIASHNVKNYGLLFNRLDEVQVNDMVNFESSYGNIQYVVYDIEIVDGDDTNCFNKLQGIRNLSLVTCHGDKRCIVYCKEIT